MSIRPGRRLPKRFNRGITSQTRSLIKKRYRKPTKRRTETFKKIWRKILTGARHGHRMAIRWLAVCLVGLVLFGIGIALFSPIFHVREISVVRATPRLDISKVQHVLAPLFGRHVLFLEESEVHRLLDAHVPDLATVSTTKQFPSKLEVRISLDPLVARLMVVDPQVVNVLTDTGSQVDFITAEGVYVASTAVQDSEALPDIRLTDWGARPNPGTQLIPTALVSRLLKAEQEIQKQFGQAVTIRTVYLRAREFHLLVDGISLWFDLVTPLDDQMKRYRTFLRSIEPGEVREYIDLRIEGRVIYK